MQPKESNLTESTITLQNRKILQLSGVEDVISYHEGEVLIKTVLGILRIIGEQMQIDDLSVMEHRCHIIGQIDGMIYEKSVTEQKLGFWSRLIR